MEHNKVKKIKLKFFFKGGEKEPGRGKNKYFFFRSKREKHINYVELGLFIFFRMAWAKILVI